jgi:hypothetical protein
VCADAALAGQGNELLPCVLAYVCHNQSACQWSVTGFGVGDRGRPAITGGNPAGTRRGNEVPSPLLDPAGRVPLPGGLRLADPPTLSAHLDTTWPSLGSTVSIIARPVVRASTVGGALARHRLVSAASSSEPPNERGVGVPSSRSLATASREADQLYGEKRPARRPRGVGRPCRDDRRQRASRLAAPCRSRWRLSARCGCGCRCGGGLLHVLGRGVLLRGVGVLGGAQARRAAPPGWPPLRTPPRTQAGGGHRAARKLYWRRTAGRGRLAMADRVKDWCKRHAGWLAIIFAVLAVVLLGVVCFQASWPYSCGMPGSRDRQSTANSCRRRHSPAASTIRFAVL